jgi:ABC-type glycerol-3-phosphate transport system substrate-binding protein
MFEKKINRRQFIQGASVVAAGAAMAACSPQAATIAAPADAGAAATTAPSTEKATAPAVITKGTKLRVALFSTQIGDQWPAVANGFKTKFPEMDVEFLPVSGIDWEEYIGKIVTQVAAGNPPDICHVATEGCQVFAGQGVGHALDDFVKRDKDEMQEYFSDVHPSLVQAMMYEGSLYELPTDFNAPNIYYRKDLTEAAGISRPADDWTKDDFYEMVKKLTKKNGSNTEVFGFGWTNRLWGSWTPWMFVNGSNLLTEEIAPGGDWVWDTFYGGKEKSRGGGWRWPAPKANDPANIEALDFMVQLLNEGLTPTTELGSGQSLDGFFMNGSLAMCPAGGFWVDGLKQGGLKKDQFDVQFWPKWKTQRHQFGTAGFAILEAAKDKDAAWEWCKYFSGKPAMEAFYAQNTTTPTRRSMMTQARYGDTGPEHWQCFYDTLDKYPDTAPIPAPKQANPMTNILTKYTSLAMSLEKTPKEALDLMQADLEKLFAQG